MKRGTPNHPKTLDLTARLARLGVPAGWGVRGILESIWLFAQAYAKRGDVGRFTNAAIAEGMGWTGDPDALVDALVAARWLDHCDCHRLRVHDWPDHADQGVQRSEEVKRYGFLECYGRVRAAAAGEAEKLATAASTLLAVDASEKLAAATRQPLPYPLPLPVPSNGPTPLPPPAAAGGGLSNREANLARDRLAVHARTRGRPYDRQALRRIRQLLREGVPESKLFDDLEQLAAADAKRLAEEEAWRQQQGTAEAWITDHGGASAVAQLALEHVRAGPPGQDLGETLKRWAADAGAPAGVAGAILPAVYVLSRDGPPARGAA